MIWFCFTSDMMCASACAWIYPAIHTRQTRSAFGNMCCCRVSECVRACLCLPVFFYLYTWNAVHYKIYGFDKILGNLRTNKAAVAIRTMYFKRPAWWALFFLRQAKYFFFLIFRRDRTADLKICRLYIDMHSFENIWTLQVPGIYMRLKVQTIQAYTN